MPLSDAALDRLRQAADTPDLTGTRYELRHEVGRGGMGTVYLVHDTALNRDVALKVLVAEGADAAFLGRLRREAAVLAGLEHPGIVPVHDVGTLPDGRLYYTMKFIAGERLDRWLAAGRGTAEKLRVFLKVCDPVAFAHARGVVHRDLKPQNIMLGSFGEVLVLDWGIAKVSDEPAGHPGEPGEAVLPSADGADSVTAAGTVLGTPGYMAPEQAAGRVDLIDQRSDVYALGALLRFMLTEQRPIGDEARQTSQWPATVSKPLRAIADKASAGDPGSRYQTANLLAQDVARFLDGGAVAAYRESLWERLGRLFLKYQTPILLVTAYVVVRLILLLVREE